MGGAYFGPKFFSKLIWVIEEASSEDEIISSSHTEPSLNKDNDSASKGKEPVSPRRKESCAPWWCKFRPDVGDNGCPGNTAKFL